MVATKQIIEYFRNLFVGSGKNHFLTGSTKLKSELSKITEVEADVVLANDSAALSREERIEELRKIAELRIKLEQHYNLSCIPKELNAKIKNENSSISGCKEIPQSTNDFSNVCNHFFALDAHDEVIKSFVRGYFACIPLNKKILDEVLKYCTNYDLQLSLVNNVINSFIWKKFDEKIHCHIKVLKYLIEQLEEQKVEICGNLYDCLIQLLTVRNRTFGHRIYLNKNFDRYIVIKEKIHQLSNGTTGLSCWQASCDLAHYLLGVGAELLEGRDIIELGAGCGLAGIAAAASSRIRSLTLTDCNDEVLELIKANCRNNFTKEQLNVSQISVKYLDWRYYKIDDLRKAYNLIIASDLMFDPELAKPLVLVIRDILAKSNDDSAECIIAGVKRNENTYNYFMEMFKQNHLAVTETFLFDNGCFIFTNGKIVRDASNFLFSSSVDLPTVFHRIKYNKQK